MSDFNLMDILADVLATQYKAHHTLGDAVNVVDGLFAIADALSGGFNDVAQGLTEVAEAIRDHALDA